MDFWLWSFYFLSVSGALRTLPEIQVDGELGGSVTIECPLPLPETHVRIYLCRETADSKRCSTVVSNKFVKEEYRDRVTLQPCPDKNLFQVEVTDLTESDSGVYACGTGKRTNRGKTQKVTLNVHIQYEPFWEKEPPQWFPKFPHLPHWLQMLPHASSSEFTDKATMPTQRTEAPPVQHLYPTSRITHHPQVSRATSVATAKPTTLLPSTTASKTSALARLLKSRTASYNHHTRLHKQRAFNYGSQSEREGQEFHILIPTILGLCLLALLVLVVKRAIERRTALSRRARRRAVRMRALESARRPRSQRPRAQQRPRCQNNLYSACPRRARGADAAGDGEAPVPGPGALTPPAPPPVSPAPSLIGSRGSNGRPRTWAWPRARLLWLQATAFPAASGPAPGKRLCPFPALLVSGHPRPATVVGLVPSVLGKQSSWEKWVLDA
ncbi:fas apoptotic inhibitory molecule 3, partial [Carlito syrichta]|uniref:Fas apoptotic inhibitory molecule 3 n=1 Tax=Carlito syrichta TaxID=1868482 RepID=A0A1U7U1N2_CARSF